MLTDIALCKGERCSVKEKCQRNISSIGVEQGYFVHPRKTKELLDEDCDYFYKAKVPS